MVLPAQGQNKDIATSGVEVNVDINVLYVYTYKTRSACVMAIDVQHAVFHHYSP